MYETHTTEVPVSTSTLLENLPIFLSNKDFICSSFLGYNIESGCFYQPLNQPAYQLFLGDILNLWTCGLENIWHFINEVKEEYYTFKVFEISERELLLFSYNTHLNQVEVCITENYCKKAFDTMLSKIDLGYHPHTGKREKVSSVPAIRSTLDMEDLRKALYEGKSYYEVYANKHQPLKLPCLVPLEGINTIDGTDYKIEYKEEVILHYNEKHRV